MHSRVAACYFQTESSLEILARLCDVVVRPRPCFSALDGDEAKFNFDRCKRHRICPLFGGVIPVGPRKPCSFVG